MYVYAVRNLGPSLLRLVGAGKEYWILIQWSMWWCDFSHYSCFATQQICICSRFTVGWIPIGKDWILTQQWKKITSDTLMTILQMSHLLMWIQPKCDKCGHAHHFTLQIALTHPMENDLQDWGRKMMAHILWRSKGQEWMLLSYRWDCDIWSFLFSSQTRWINPSYPLWCLNVFLCLCISIIMPKCILLLKIHNLKYFNCFGKSMEDLKKYKIQFAYIFLC